MSKIHNYKLKLCTLTSLMNQVAILYSYSVLFFKVIRVVKICLLILFFRKEVGENEFFTTVIVSRQRMPRYSKFEVMVSAYVA